MKMRGGGGVWDVENSGVYSEVRGGEEGEERFPIKAHFGETFRGFEKAFEFRRHKLDVLIMNDHIEERTKQIVIIKLVLRQIS